MAGRIGTPSVGGPGGLGALAAKKAAQSMVGGVSGVGGRGGQTAPVSRKAAAPRRAPAPRAPIQTGGGGAVSRSFAPSISGGDSGGGALGTSATGAVAEIAAEPPAPIQLGEDEWRAQDSAYLGEEAGLNLSMEQALAQLRDQRVNYQTDYGQSMKNLGWNWQDQNNDGLPDDAELQAGSWDPNNQQGAYGQAYKNQLDDFSGRGMLDSTFYTDARAEQDRGFTNQFDQNMAARNNYLKQLAGEENNTRDTTAQGLARAKAEASARRAAAYGLG